MSDEPPRPARVRRSSYRRLSLPPGRTTLRGICASPGVAVGNVTIFDRRSVPIPRRAIGTVEVDGEVQRLMSALATSRRELEEARDAIDPSAGAEHRLVLEAHLLMHRDELFVGAAVEGIRSGINAEWAVRRAIEAIVRRLMTAREAYLSDRARDVEQVGEHVLRVLTGVGFQLPVIDRPTILVASDLSPAETARLPRDRVLALVTDLGTATSHTAILARALGIPAVVGVDGVTRTLTPGCVVVVDALRGEIVVEPDEDTQHRAEERARRYRHFTGRLRDREGASGQTRDGVRVEVLANVELEVEVDEAHAQRAEGIGLYRTEFLYLEDELPSEEIQTELYARVASRFGPRPVTLRTFDLGADKMPLLGTSALGAGRSPNPALGLRGLRLSLACPDLFRVQLRAMMRAAAIAPLRVMFPMVCTLEDLRAARAMVAEARAELERDGIPYRAVPLGAMIEVPSAVVLADALARECDFFSVGTNDLAQYTLAVDRQNPRLSHIARPLEPAVLRLLDLTFRASRDASIPISICGDLASHPIAVPVLLGLGYRCLSMSASEIPLVREILDRVDLVTCEEVARASLACATGSEVERLVVEALAPVLGEVWDEQGIELSPAR
ncbi:phosphoenolpyruvate--protein phosphotransferase [Sandaracinus amylolyticus]|uniref:Phosphoenolpyruvate-protein phosphotransferase n=1 Tax=Sandaracinus amylolyticus TaxID=927083 RepID=A0A0F6YII1_9BACT|nr:phosphoenolpyruvate--protein phosphotransferase [Sandaracinus amylolyticus]AKF05947.1 Phosphoenolpyruvate-protein phosphotransferase of PTS system [Sandaracinus amylolyticus]